MVYYISNPAPFFDDVKFENPIEILALSRFIFFLLPLRPARRLLATCCADALLIF
jgi:hypothetical protein